MDHKLFDLSGRVALVTGGSKGLGKAMARGFAEAGADIVICSRHESELQSALDEILAGTDSRGAYLVADLSQRDQVQPLADYAIAQMGHVDILVNNAGSNVPEEWDQITEENWNRYRELYRCATMPCGRGLVPE